MVAPQLNGNQLEVEQLVKSKSKSLKPKKENQIKCTHEIFRIRIKKKHTTTLTKLDALLNSRNTLRAQCTHTCTLPQSGKVYNISSFLPSGIHGLTA